VKAVFDTNVLVAAFVSEGVCSKLLTRARKRQFQLFVSHFILQEFERVLIRKLRVSRDEARDAVRLVSEAADIILHPPELDTPICRDSNDDKVLACSLAAEADYLVTGDADLLDLRSFPNTLIVSPRDFESLFVD
jgi:putative PIN family toxin of toxin-antitoxin system